MAFSSMVLEGSVPGPTLPDDAGSESLYFCLREFWETLDGPRLRTQAAVCVRELWEAGDLTSWADAHLIIEHHAPHAEIDEGLEGVPWEIVPDSDGGDSSGQDDDDHEGGDSDGSGGDGGGGGGAVGPASDVDADGAFPEGEADPEAPAAPAGGEMVEHDAAEAPASEEQDEDEAVRSALKVLAVAAQSRRDDRLLRIVRDAQRRDQIKRRAECGVVPEALRKAARRDREEAELARRERQELQRLADLKDLEAQRALEESKERAHAERRKSLEAARTFHQEVAARRDRTARQRADARWLQTRFPLDLAQRLLRWREGLSRTAVKHLTQVVSGLSESSRIRRNTEMPLLWEPNLAWTKIIANELAGGGRRISIRSTTDFEWLVFGGPRCSSLHDCSYMMFKLIERIVPKGRQLFRIRYTAQVLLAECEGVLEKMFVYAIILLSKWLGVDIFPEGVHEWPPAFPDLPPEAAAAPTAIAPAVATSGSSSSSGAPPLAVAGRP